MGKAEILVLKPGTMTYAYEKKTVKETIIEMDKDNKPSFTPGLSQFQEEEKLILGRWSNPLQKKRKILLIWLEGASKCFELLSPKKIDANYWTKEDAKKFVSKAIAKSKAEQKPMSNLQFIGLAGIGIATIAFLVFIASRIGIF